ncbi:protein kinase domain-containing protein [Spirillospora sp. CA-108201]
MPHADLPERIGPYRVVDRVGEGGMGTVYAGLDASGRKVALKVIRREYAADRQYRARFEAEVAAAKRVRPFCTAPVLDADPGADPPYLVTEFVNGPSLDDAVVKEGPLRGADLEAVAVGIATALTAIHAAGVVHRDLKPANVLLSTFGPRVIDFGISRSLDGTRLTATGGIVGTPAFMAPEQLDGRGASPASDVFAWGATVAFAARGGPCFAGNSLPAVIHRIISGEPDLGGLDGMLLKAVRAALAKDPARRPSAQSLLDGLISSGVRQPAPSTQDIQAPGRHRAETASVRGRDRTEAPGTQAPGIAPALAAGEAAALVEGQYRQAAQAGDPAAMRNLAVLLGGQGRTAEAESWNRYADAIDARPAAYQQPAGYQQSTGYQQPTGYQQMAGYQTGYQGHPTQAPHHYPAAGHPHAKPPMNSLAIYAVSMGAVGLITCGLPSIPAIVAGHMAWVRLRRSGERGLGLAVTGIALGWIMVAFWALVAFGAALPNEN